MMPEESVAISQEGNEEYDIDEAELIRRLLGHKCESIANPEETKNVASEAPRNLEFFTQTDESGTFLRFYFMDANEDSTGQVTLFGKIVNKDEPSQTYSCAVTVENVTKNVFLRPRNQPDDVDDPLQRKAVLLSLKTELRSILEKVDCPEAVLVPRVRRVVLEAQSKSGSEPLAVNKRELYIKMSFPGTFRLPSSGCFQTDSITHVFGLRTSPLEALLIKRRIWGPSWLKVYKIELAPPKKQECCTFSLTVPIHKAIFPLESAKPLNPPGLTLLTLNLKASKIGNVFKCACLCLSGRKQFKLGVTGAQPSSDECLLLYLNPSHFNVSQLPSPSPFNRTFTQMKDFLAAFIQASSLVDPDIIISHDFYGHTLPVLAQMLTFINPANWSKLSRQSQSNALPANFTRMPIYQQARMLFRGRLICDTYILAQEALGSRTEYTIRSLLTEMGHAQIANALVAAEELPTFIQAWLARISKVTAEKFPSLSRLIEHVCHAANRPIQPSGSMLMDLMTQSMRMETQWISMISDKLNLLNLTLELAVVSGSLWDRSLFCQRAERNEFLLLHKFREEKIIPPGVEHRLVKPKTKNKANANTGQRNDALAEEASGPSYEGGLVLEPLSGYYDTYILYLDFASLYPSIIQEFNLCFTTCKEAESGNLDVERKRVQGSTAELGILPRLLQDLVQKRRRIKSEIYSTPPHLIANLQIRQKALKLVANSIYGSLGYHNFRFYSPHIAATVTAWGRHILMMTKDRVERQMGCSVVYGDTDSLMINSGLRDEKNDNAQYYVAQNTAKTIVQEINKHHNKLELEVEGIFKKLLLLKKKKYAALRVSDPVKRVYEKELKGIDIVRRDWCGLTKVLGHQLIDLIFDQTVEDSETLGNAIATLLSETRDKMKENKFPLSLYVITKSLTKAPEAYPNPKQSPHVVVALEMQRSGAQIHPGLEIPYVVCVESRQSDSKSIADRSYPPNVVGLKNLTVDITWYTNNQVFPPILRLCQFIQSLTPQRLKEALGCTNISAVGMEGSMEPLPVDVFEAQNSSIEELKIHMKACSGSTEIPLIKDVLCPQCSTSVALEDYISSGSCLKCHKSFGLVDIMLKVQDYVHELVMTVVKYEIK
eukprot:Gregarina_sp_Poly_1__5550@NODE_292_length_9900_cov_48_311299_g253_i0_p1_GENE_NODE_292_length_9900_cov_48_311299_g253_i0NODE_292_length_9900_cov_48_311299_g253_i0_p1_ORF_typecomplete_len1111_score169_13DNA_pol_B/PF00136_21/9_5e99DNA_pol_B_exo1/PF03104_19/5_2e22DNA_pol_B_2/PF03175_13/0_0019DUF1744/PF08490_12/0_0077Glyco_transf_4/PF13439_6/0_45Glyco_transf_4/PF13439_6/8_9e03_NODE_292_length_9900_cov_48_311299_g253_i032876619